MEKFTKLTSPAAPLDMVNVDTDMIIPKEYLKTIKKTGLGFAAFAELRYQNPVEVAKAGTPDGVAVEVDDFVLNRPEYRERAGRDGVGTRVIGRMYGELLNMGPPPLLAIMKMFAAKLLPKWS